MYIINKLWDCGIFQGANKKNNYFEGWYFKHVDKQTKNIISIIPGISYEDSPEKSHAFIQVIEGSKHQTHYIRYKAEEFSFCKDKFEIRIADSFFSHKGIHLNIKNDDLQIEGSLAYRNPISWGSSIAAPNSMGWYAYIPYMECYHGVLSMGHDIEGDLKINRDLIPFHGGTGYMEKDWGTSFPSSWVWLQSNHFASSQASVMVSVAKIPWHTKSFIGFLTALWCNGKLYKFTTYTGAKIDYLEHTDNWIRVKLSDKRYSLEIEAEQSDTGALSSPVQGAMIGNVQESVRASASITLYETMTGRQIFHDVARPCGMEIAGDTQELVNRP